jgi:protein-tyrosine phosphatase
MPGRIESITEFDARILKLSIRHVLCLTPIKEVIEKSPDYYSTISTGKHPWLFHYFPIPDYGVPDDRDGFLFLSELMAKNIFAGDAVLTHCGAGIGRAGTFAMVIAMALGMSRQDGAAAVRMADAEPEGISQQVLIDWCADELQKKNEIEET